jgi:hypothetical protein
MVGIIALIEFYYLNDTGCLVLSFVYVHLFVLSLSFALAYFIIGLLAVEQVH